MPDRPFAAAPGAPRRRHRTARSGRCRPPADCHRWLRRAKASAALYEVLCRACKVFPGVLVGRSVNLACAGCRYRRCAKSPHGRRPVRPEVQGGGRFGSRRDLRSFGHRSWRRRGHHLGLARTPAEPTAKNRCGARIEGSDGNPQPGQRWSEPSLETVEAEHRSARAKSPHPCPRAGIQPNTPRAPGTGRGAGRWGPPGRGRARPESCRPRPVGAARGRLPAECPP